MSNNQSPKNKRIRNLVLTTVLTAVLLSVSTYAWFIGMQTVNVEAFDVEIASVDSLLLSLDGDSWGPTVSINKDNLNTVSYVGHTNSWGGAGLVPVSSVGAMDPGQSRMVLYEKASVTKSLGGYRMMASRVNNYGVGSLEQEGYVVFDLFVKNFTGDQYIESLNILDEEAIYLTTDSNVTVSSAGVAGTGIENSVRVAFTQIGRVDEKVEDASIITGITCEDATVEDVNVTGICRAAQIWEPNDTFHVNNAISWYETSCLARSDIATFGGDCGLVVDGQAYPTYAVNQPITSAPQVDVYDGEEYNGYTASTTAGEEETPLLKAVNTFTDTKKFIAGQTRPDFMYLAPASITKVRVYIYLEGQDIDNYDLASVGKSISIKFGFTKNPLTEGDVGYDGPDVNQGEGPLAGDKTAPVITITGGNSATMVADTSPGATYTLPEATVTDNVSEAENMIITTTGTVNPAVPGTYRIVYHATDEANNIGFSTLTVVVTEE